jgi:hypothetical protein
VNKINYLLTIQIFVFSQLCLATTRISVMNYNVENLFDTVDDPKTNDETYLPLEKKQSAAHKAECRKTAGFGGRLWDCEYLDWNKSLLEKKMKNLAEQILSSPAKCPDILTFDEVENKSVVEELSTKYLSKCAYHVTHVDSPDRRGIDQAILSKFPLYKNQMSYHQITSERKGGSQKPLRGILHAKFSVAGKILNVLALHLPSQGAPWKEREHVLGELNKLALQIPANEVLIASGDFNITSVEWENRKVYSNYFQNIWSVSNKEGCRSCAGTYYYAPKKQWSFFDILLLRLDREKKARWHWDANSIQTVSAKKLDHPIRFDPITKTGASDHFPIYGELVID